MTANRTQAAGRGSSLVYSTDQGRICPACSQPIEQCKCGRREVAASGCEAARGRSESAAPRRQTTPTGRGIVRVGKETKGRRGKGVTVITGISLPPPELLELGARLKKICGAGGTVKDGVIEIQGEHRDALLEELSNLGYAAKRSGG